MVSDRLESPRRPRHRAAARGFTLTEMMTVIAIIFAVLAIAVPSFTAVNRDLGLSKARSDVFAALTAARSRAITNRNMVALHIFRDNGVYSVARDSADPTQVGYDQSTAVVNAWRWGVNFNAVTGLPDHGLPHIPTNKMIMRLEVPNPDAVHNIAGTDLTGTPVTGAVEFFWPADHDPVILPDSLGIVRPYTDLAYTAYTEQSEVVATQGRVSLAEDFYIVFTEDGKIATVLPDYDLLYNKAASATNKVLTEVYPDATSTVKVANAATWSASGLCLYDMTKFKSLPTTGSQYTYVNSQGCLVMLSPYTGLPLTEATK